MVDIYSSITSSKNEASCPTAGFCGVVDIYFIHLPGLEPAAFGWQGGRGAKSSIHRGFFDGFGAIRRGFFDHFASKTYRNAEGI